MLRVWLPLTKDLRNQGLSEVTVTNNGATYNATGGKLGGCYSFDGDDYITIVSNDLKTLFSSSSNKHSMACWIYLNSDETDRVIIFGNYSANPFMNWELTAICQQRVCAGGTSNYTTKGDNTIVEKQNWTHICYTYDGMNTAFYINGVKKSTTSGTNTLTAMSSNTFWIGSDIRSGVTRLKGRLNDFRLYDHCLSPMEVKQISQGLVLHYPLDNNGFGNENLVLNSDTFATGTGASGITPSTTSDGLHQVIAASGNSNWHTSWATSTATSLLENAFAEGDPFTISFTIKSENANKTNPPDIYVKNGMGYYSMQGKVTSNWSTVYYSGTWKDANSISFHLGFSGRTGTYLFKNWKVEKGLKPTPWCPNSSDALATTMGLDSITEYDCSGFCNNGTRMGTFGWTSNTPKYVVSQVFNGTDNAIQTPSLPTMISDKNYTVACWTYKTVIGTKNYQTIYGGPSGFELEARSSSSTSPLYRIHNWGGGTAAYNFGEWTHFCFVHTDSDSKLYVNGELKITGTSVNIPSGNYFVGAWNTSTQQNFEGLMSDFRIYATALSASDIQSLYQNSAYIDSSGNVYGAVHEEV